MPAPASTPPAAPAPPRGRLNPPRLLGAITFAALGFVAVWQGFGLAGFGTDVHLLRVLAAVVPLFACGLVLVWPKMWLPVRAAVVLVGLGAAGWGWWEVRSSNLKSAMPLREAVEARDRYRELLASATVEDVERYEGLRGIDLLAGQYPSLAAGLAADYGAWKDWMAGEIRARYERVPTDDPKAVLALRAAAKSLGTAHAPARESLDAADREWVDRARRARADELAKLPPGDWPAFDRTAPGRQALAEAFPEARDPLVRAEAEWVDSAAELLVSDNLTPKPGESPARPAFWLQAHADILSLQSLDSADGRFAKTRLRLFTVAHAAAQRSITARLDAGDYAGAFGIARKHAVDWNATAAVLGAAEVAKLDALRKTCEGLAAFAAKAAPPPEPIDLAPPPRPRP
jgi:hypothetical protein